jgi:hypothetical protein
MVVSHGGTKYLIDLATLTAERLPYTGKELELKGQDPFTIQHKGPLISPYLIELVLLLRPLGASYTMTPWKVKESKKDPDPAYALSPNGKIRATFTDTFTILVVGEGSTA